MTDGATPATADAATPDASEGSTFDAIEATMMEAYDRASAAPDAVDDGAGEAPPQGDGEPEQRAADIAADDEQTDQQDQAPSEGAGEPRTAAIDAPASWSAEMKARWAELPPDVQAYAAQREMEAHKRISELGQAVKQTEPIRNVVDHYQDVFQAANVQPEQGIAMLLEAQKRLDTDPAGAIREIAQAYGVDLSHAGQPGAEGSQQESDVIRSLRAEIASMKREMGQTREQVQARERSERERQQAALATLIDDFAKDKDDFADIEGDVVSHIRAIREAEPGLDNKAILEKAYDAARWSNPATRARLLERQQAEAEAKRAEEAKKKATEAKKAASINVKSKGGTPAPTKGSWEDTLSEAADRAYSA